MSRTRHSIPEVVLHDSIKKHGSLASHKYSYSKPKTYMNQQWDPKRDIHVIPENDDAPIMAINANNLIINISNGE